MPAGDASLKTAQLIKMLVDSNHGIYRYRSIIAAVHESEDGVRREKAALFQWVQIPPGERSSRKQPEQLWRKRSG